MSFEQRLDEMQKLYMDTERQFQEVIHIIPIDNSPLVYSPRFYNILQFTCAQIDSLFKIICKQLDIKVANENFPEFYKALNKKGMLQKQEVFLFERKDFLQPFNKTEKHEWWTGYNDTKHQLPEGIVQGTLGNVLDALAGAFVLNNIAGLTKWFPNKREHLLDEKNWMNTTYDKIDFNTIWMMKHSGDQNPIKNSTFFHLISEYEQFIAI